MRRKKANDMNNMEIKVGDKVRVSKDAPKIYTPDWVDEMFNLVLKVTKVEDGNAMVVFAKRTPYKTVLTAIPCKYLVKVDAEAKEPKYKVGDKVRYIGDVSTYKGKAFVIDGEVFFNNHYNEWQTRSIKPFAWDGLSVCNVPLTDLKPYTEPTAPTIKVGDIVIVKQDVEMFKILSIFKREVSIVKRIDNDKATLEINRMKHQDLELTDVPLECIEKVDAIEYLHGNRVASTEQTEAEKKSNHAIAIPVEVDLTDSYWDAYAADLAKEIALKVVNKYDNPTEAAECAVQVAKAVVENLKNKQI